MAVQIDLEWIKAHDWWSKVEILGPNDCWLWKQSLGSHGYGQTWDGSHVTVSHRVAWMLHNGRQVPNGLSVDHLCHNRPCCNPNHLRLLTPAMNGRLNAHYYKTHCPHGHPYDASNTRYNAKGHRFCRTCDRAATGQRGQKAA